MAIFFYQIPHLEHFPITKQDNSSELTERRPMLTNGNLSRDLNKRGFSEQKWSFSCKYSYQINLQFISILCKAPFTGML